MVMTENGKRRAVIGDFGLVMKSGSKIDRKCGTPGYISPDVIREGNVSSVSDIFSAGIIFHILLTGRPLFVGVDV